MRVLVADKFEESGLDGLAALGCEVISEPDLQGDALGEAIRQHGPEILIVRGTKVEGAMFEGSPIKVIIRAGAGYNTIDVATATKNGIKVCNCPGKNAQAVAELAFGLILALDRFIPDNVNDLRSGRWNKKTYSKAKGIYGCTLGLVGMGMIGQEMVPRAKAFGMNVLAHSTWMTDADASNFGVSRAASMEDLAARSDIVSVHSSLRPETKGLVGGPFFAAMKQGALFVNTSRAELVDQTALVAAVKSGKIRAGLDVFENEPTGGEGEYDGELRNLPGVYCTHHIGASTEQAQEAVAAETVRIVKEFMATGMAPNAVN
ncbi:MAG: hydroxyacid dehydrogenase [Armatimonadetes bacterium]|nr:hydroxyacid dehydrogenase [Armatimonadota bacterium]